MEFESEQNHEFSSVTQCPYCETAFHVGLSQLDAANGKVRCGGCLRVFNAKDHFLVEQKRLFDDETAKDSSSNETALSEAPPMTTEDDRDSLGVDLFGAEIPDDDQPVILGNFDHHSGASIPRDAILKHKVDRFRQEDYEHASADQVLGNHQHLTEPENIFEEVEITSSKLIEDEFIDLSAEPATSERGASGLPRQEADDKEDHQASEFFISHENNKRTDSSAGWSWRIMLVIVTLALPVQLLFQQPEFLVSHAWFRDIGGEICAYIGCKKPVYKDVSSIKISGFIEPHPEYEDSLIAKIDLRNNAISEQAFPNIAIFFRSLRGKITASRKFAPSDYLRGEVRALKDMPVGRNIQIELEIVDPGQQSTSYELYVTE